MQELKNKVAIVTGAGHPLGMGFNSAKKLAQAGAKVVLTDICETEQQLAELNNRAQELRESGAEVFAHPVDVRNREQIQACVDTTLEKYHSIDILFNNAGSPDGVGNFLEMTDFQWDNSYQVNVKGVVNFCQAVLPHMLKQKSGSIINNASLLGLGAKPQMSAYCATKSALIALSKSLAAEFGASGVRVNAICPGNIWTQMSEIEADIYTGGGADREQVLEQMVEDVALGRWGQSDDIGNLVVFLASDKSSYITGTAMPIAGGLEAGL